MALFLFPFTPGTPACALESVADVSGDAGEIERYLRGKYDIGDMRLVFWPGGEVKRVWLRGEITPPASSNAGDNAGKRRRPSDLRSIAWPFIREEGRALFGVERVEDIKEGRIKTYPSGTTNITYYRYMGECRVEGFKIVASIKGGQIVSVMATMRPVTEEMEKAAASGDWIDVHVAKSIVSRMLEESGLADGVMKGKKIELDLVVAFDAPHLLWIASVGFLNYTIDATNGKLIGTYKGKTRAGKR